MLAFQVELRQRTHLPIQETQQMLVQSLGWVDPLEEGMATHPSVLAWRIPWTEEPGRLHFMRSQRVRHNWSHSDWSHSETFKWSVCSAPAFPSLIHTFGGLSWGLFWLVRTGHCVLMAALNCSETAGPRAMSLPAVDTRCCQYTGWDSVGETSWFHRSFPSTPADVGLLSFVTRPWENSEASRPVPFLSDSRVTSGSWDSAPCPGQAGVSPSSRWN